MASFGQEYDRRIGGAREEELVNNAEVIAQLIDRLGFPKGKMYVWDPTDKFLKIYAIANRLTKIPVIRLYDVGPYQSVPPFPFMGVVDRKVADDPVLLLNELRKMGFDTDSAGTLYEQKRFSGHSLHSYEVRKFPNFVLLRDTAFNFPATEGEVIKLPPTPSNIVTGYYMATAYAPSNFVLSNTTVPVGPDTFMQIPRMLPLPASIV